MSSHIIDSYKHKGDLIPTDALLFYKCDETSGDVINYGSLGSNLDLETDFGGKGGSPPTQTAGGIEFDGTSWAEATHADLGAAINGLTTATLCGWAKAVSYQWNPAWGITKNNGNEGFTTYPYTDAGAGNKGAYHWWTGSELEESITTPVNLPDGDYHFFMVRVSAEDLRELFSGSGPDVDTDTSPDRTLNSDQERFTMGAYNPGSDEFVGGVKYVRLYGYDVSEEQRAALATEFPE